MRKTILFSMTALVIVAVALSACGGTSATQAPADQDTGAPAAEVTLKVLIHQNPPMVAFMEEFNKKFQEKHPSITIDMSVVNANDLSTVTQTRLTANDVDVVDIFGFSNGAQPYMKMVDAPNWQQLIDAGLLMDLSDQAFIKNYDASAIKDAGTYNGKVYAINLGRVSYSGIYYNKDLFAAHNVKVPTTWSELVTACETFNAAGIPCMTAGGRDGWPIFVGAYGLIGAVYPDQAALVEGLWTGTIKWNDAKSLEMWEKMQIYARDMMEEGASGIAGDAAPGRFASGAVAMFPGGTWYGPRD
ncbi:MAG: extracellular solute-binding protein [Chloroflexi bacterium]|nr:extracellular solute-binding protein [Chloroflexota bacterium]